MRCIADQFLREKLANVYFIWGSGKTTIARTLQEKHGYFVYSTDESRSRLMRKATPEQQPYMCRDYLAEYGVTSFWALPPEVIADREQHFLVEMTPMILSELVILAAQHSVILCEGDIDYAAVIPVAANTVHLRNVGRPYDWFERTDHRHMLEGIRCRPNLTPAEKEAILRNAYAAVAGQTDEIPDWVVDYGIVSIPWGNGTTPEQTAGAVGRYFGFANKTPGRIAGRWLFRQGREIQQSEPQETRNSAR